MTSLLEEITAKREREKKFAPIGCGGLIAVFILLLAVISEFEHRRDKCYWAVSYDAEFRNPSRYNWTDFKDFKSRQAAWKFRIQKQELLRLVVMEALRSESPSAVYIGPSEHFDYGLEIHLMLENSEDSRSRKLEALEKYHWLMGRMEQVPGFWWGDKLSNERIMQYNKQPNTLWGKELDSERYYMTTRKDKSPVYWKTIGACIACLIALFIRLKITERT